MDENGFPVCRFVIPIREEYKSIIRKIVNGEKLSAEETDIDDRLKLSRIEQQRSGTLLAYLHGTPDQNTADDRLADRNDGARSGRRTDISGFAEKGNQAGEGFISELRTSNGELYGFVYKGEIYIDETKLSPFTKVHEYGHLWGNAVMAKNPRLWKRGVDLLRQSKFWNEVIDDPNYGKKWGAELLIEEGTDFETIEDVNETNLGEYFSDNDISGDRDCLEFINRVADEVMSRALAALSEGNVEVVASEKGSKGIIQKLKDWFHDVFKFLAKTFGTWSDEQLNKLTLEDFVNLAFRDFVEGVNPNTQPLPQNVEIYKGNWTRADVAKQTDKVFLFGDNYEDAKNGHVPSITQAVIRGLPNAIGVPTKIDRGTVEESYMSDYEYEDNIAAIDEAIDKALESGKTIVIPEAGIGTGKAMLREKAPRTYEHLRNRLNELWKARPNKQQVASSQAQPANAPKAVQSTPHTINIYAGTNENAHLSNFAMRPFTVNNSDTELVSKDGVKFNSVEQAFQVHKLLSVYDLLEEDKFNALYNELMSAKTGAEAKSLGRKIPMNAAAVKAWDERSSDVMEELVKASFEQNPQAAQQLLATGNATLTHTQDKGKWGKEFPRILMEVRDELRNSQQQTTQLEPVGQGAPQQENKPNLTADSELAKRGDHFQQVSRENMIKLIRLHGRETPIRPGSLTVYKTASDKHFSNPWSANVEDQNRGYLPANSNDEAVQNYIDWLTGTKFQDVEPERRQWIVDNIVSGALADKTILCAESNVTTHASALHYLIHDYDWRGQRVIDDNNVVRFTNVEELDGLTSTDTTPFYLSDFLANISQQEVRSSIIEAIEGMESDKVEIPSIQAAMLIKQIAMSDIDNKQEAIKQVLECGSAKNVQNLIQKRYSNFAEAKNSTTDREELNTLKAAYRAYFLTSRGRNAYTNLDRTGTSNIYADEPVFSMLPTALMQVRDELRLERGERRKALRQQQEMMKKGPDAITTNDAVMLSERIAQIFTEVVNQLEHDLPDKERTGNTLTTRRYIIAKKYGVANLQEHVFKIIEERYCNEANIRARMAQYYDIENMSQEDVQEAVDNCREYGRQMLEFKDALFLMANSYIKNTEGVSITDENGELIDLSEYESDKNEEEATKHDDGWLNEVGTQSAAELVDREIKILESTLLHMRMGENGDWQINTDPENMSVLIEPIPYNFTDVHNPILQSLNFVRGAEDMMPVLERLSAKYDWAQQLLYVLGGIDTPQTHIYEGMTEEQRQRKAMNLQAKFWRSNHRSFMEIATLQGNKVTILNRSQGQAAALEQFREAVYSHSPIYGHPGVKPVYNQDGTFNDEAYDELNARHNSKENDIYRTLLLNYKANIKKYKDYTDEQRQALYHATAQFASDLLAGFGMDVPVRMIEEILTDENLTDDQKTGRLKLISDALSGFYKTDNSNNLPLKSSGYITPQNRTKEKQDANSRTKKSASSVFDAFNSNYQSVARAIEDYMPSREESIATYMDKDGLVKRFSNVNPIPIIDIFNLLANRGGLSEADYAKLLDERYLHNWWFRTDAYGIRNMWLAMMMERPATRASFRAVNLMLADGRSYSEQGEALSLLSRLRMFASTEGVRVTDEGTGKTPQQFRYYSAPTASDQQVNYFISGPYFEVKDSDVNDNDILSMKHPIMQALRKVFIQELERIKVVSERANAYARGEQISLDANYDMKFDKDGKVIPQSGGAKFFFFKAINGELENIIKLYNDKAGVDQDALIDQYVQLALKREFDFFLNEIQKNNLGEREAKYKNLEADAVRHELLDYFYNNFLANTQIIELTMIDPAFLKDETAFQKRYKMFSSPVQTCYNTFYLMKDGKLEQQQEGLYKKNETSIILKDDIRSVKKGTAIKSLALCKAFLDKAVALGYISSKQAKLAYENLEEINASDAQAYRTLPSRELVMNMMGNASNPRIHEVIEHIISGEFTREDFDIFFTNEKPFVCGYENAASHYQNEKASEDTHYGDIITPLQHKNAEFPLLAIYEAISWEVASPKLRALNQFMVDHGIDKAHFESSTKTGIRGVIDLSDIENDDYANTLIRLEDMAMTDGVRTTEYDDYDRDVVHSMPFNYWGISTNNPEHNLNHPKSSLGTQLLKKLMEDFGPDDIIRVNDMELTRDQWLQLYKEIFVANLVESFREVNDKITDVKALSVLLKELVNNDSRYQPDLLDHLELNDDETAFRIPLLDPMVGEKIEAMCSSLLRNRVTKQNIRQAALIQVGSFGFELDAHFADENGNEVTVENASKIHHLQSVDTAMPIFDKNLFMFVDEDGNVDYKAMREKCDPKIFETLNYRIPTEAKHSMFCGHVKFLMPSQNASVCMVPPFFIATSDSDNDNDKNNVMIYETEIVWNVDAMKRDYKEDGWDKVMSFKDYVSKVKNSNFPEYISTIRPVQFKSQGSDFHSLLSAIRSNSRAARNNLLLDMARGALQTPRNSALIMTPGGFHEPTRVMTVMRALLNTENKIDDYGTLLGMEADAVEAKYNTSLESCSIANPAIRAIQHARNMVGTNLVSRHAALSTLLPQLQTYMASGGNVTVASIYRVNINGNRSLPKPSGRADFSLCHMHNAQGMYITDNVGQILGSTVDNAKKNVLYFIGQNESTAAISVAMLMQGYTIMETALFLMHPKVQEVINKVLNSKERAFVSAECSKMLKKMGVKVNEYEDVNQLVNNYPLNSIELAKAIHGEQNAQVWDVAVLVALYRLSRLANAIDDMNKFMRADTQNNSANADHWVALSKELALDEVRRKMRGETYPLRGVEGFVSYNESNPDENSLAMQFYQYGVKSMDVSMQLVSAPFQPFIRMHVDNILSDLKMRVTEENVRLVGTQLLSYLLSDNKALFEPSIGDKQYTAAEYRLFLMFTLPSIITQIKRMKDHPLHDNILFRALNANDMGNDFSNGLPTIDSRNSRRSNKYEIPRCKAGWSELLEFPDDEFTYNENGAQKTMTYRQLSNALVAYCFLKNGLHDGNGSFIMYFPQEFIEEIPGYTERLQQIAGLGMSSYRNFTFDESVEGQIIANDPLNPAFSGVVSRIDPNSLVQMTGHRIIPTILKHEYLSDYLALGSKILYKYDRITNEYVRLYTLGNQGLMYEFDFGKSSSDMANPDEVMRSANPQNMGSFFGAITDANETEVYNEIGQAMNNEELFEDETRLQEVVGDIESRLNAGIGENGGFEAVIGKGFFKLTFTPPIDPQTKKPLCLKPSKQY